VVLRKKTDYCSHDEHQNKEGKSWLKETRVAQEENEAEQESTATKQRIIKEAGVHEAVHTN
jgi:hypothetical protein